MQQKRSFKNIIITYSICLALVLTSIACPSRYASADEGSVIEVDGINYNIIDSKTCKVGENTGVSGAVKIPETITTLGGNTYDVVGIDDHAFTGCEFLITVTIPKSVKSIGDDAFFRCKNLAVVLEGEGLTTIGKSAFEQCAALSRIILPKGVTSIGDKAFSGCTSLKEVYVSKGSYADKHFQEKYPDIMPNYLFDPVPTPTLPAIPTSAPATSTSTPTPSSSPTDNSGVIRGYTAYLGFESDGPYAYRGPCMSEDGLTSTDYNYKTQAMVPMDQGEVVAKDIKALNPVMTKAGKYTTSISGIDLLNKANISNKGVATKATCFNMLYISTDIPLTNKGVKATNITLKIDGKVIKTMKEAPYKPDANPKYYMFMIADNYAYMDGINTSEISYGDPSNANCKTLLKFLPASKIEISYTIEGGDWSNLPNASFFEDDLVGTAQIACEANEWNQNCDYTNTKANINGAGTYEVTCTWDEYQATSQAYCEVRIPALDKYAGYVTFKDVTVWMDGKRLDIPVVYGTSRDCRIQLWNIWAGKGKGFDVPKVLPVKYYEIRVRFTIGVGTFLRDWNKEGISTSAITYNSSLENYIPEYNPDAPVATPTPEITPTPIPIPEPEEPESPIEEHSIGEVFDTVDATYMITSKTSVDYLLYESDKGNVKIPNTVTYDGKVYKVTGVAKEAFLENGNVESVTFGKYMKEIDDKAFYGCQALKTVKLNSGLKTIGKKAFSKCTALKKITIPKNVSSIKSDAFYGCKKLANVTIKSKKFNKNKLKKSAFRKCSSKLKMKTA